MQFTLVKPTPMDWSGKRIVAGDQVSFITKFEATQDMVAAFVDECRQMVDSIQQGYDQMVEQMNATQAAAEQVAEDVEQTGLDRQATAADRQQTGEDRAAVAADRQQTGMDAQATADGRQQTGLDAQATAADRQQTGQDVTATQQARQAAEALYSDLNAVKTARDQSTAAAQSASEDADRAETAAGQAEGAVADHEAKADPHPQYVKDSTLQASYYTKFEVDSMVANAGPSTQVGAVGTYTFGSTKRDRSQYPGVGGLVPGSSIYKVRGANDNESDFFTGTWKIMNDHGMTFSNGYYNLYSALFLRIS